MRYKRQSLLVFAIACTQLVLCGWPTTSSWGAESPVSPTAAIPKVSVIKDGFVMEVFLRFSPSGRELARIPQFGPVILSDTTSYKKARTFAVGMRMVAYSPDGTKMATAEGTDGARVWDAAVQGKRVPEAPGEIYVLETPLQVLESPSKDPKQRVFWTEFSPDGKRLITTQANGHVKVWNTSSWTVEDDLTLTDSEVRAAAFAPDGKTLVIGDVKGVLHHWSFESKTEIKSGLTREPLGAVLSLVFAPDGKTLVTSHQSRSNNTVRIWNTSTWVAQIEDGFSCAAVSKDGKTLALGGRNIKLLDPASGKHIRTIELPETTLGEFGPGFEREPNADRKIPIQIRALAFSPDASTLAAGSMGPLRLVEMSPLFVPMNPVFEPTAADDRPPLADPKKDLEQLPASTTSIRARALPDDDIPSLGRFSLLKYLSFGSGRKALADAITDKGMAHLASLRFQNLDQLMLDWCTNITDAGLPQVAQMHSVKYLSLAACPGITDAGLPSLITMTNLTTLDLRGCTGITDKGLECLATKMNWQRIMLGGCSKVTGEAVGKLQRALPNAKVEKDDREWSHHQ